MRRIPVWLRVVGGVILLVVVCGVLVFVAFDRVTSVYDPYPCVDGGPGSPAIFRNTGLQLLEFPQSASNIESSCYTWQTASIYMWFDIDADDLEPFLDSMRWDVRPLSSTREAPFFGDTQPNAVYRFGEDSEIGELEGASVWIDTSGTAYRVFMYAWLD